MFSLARWKYLPEGNEVQNEVHEATELFSSHFFYFLVLASTRISSWWYFCKSKQFSVYILKISHFYPEFETYWSLYNDSILQSVGWYCPDGFCMSLLDIFWLWWHIWYSLQMWHLSRGRSTNKNASNYQWLSSQKPSQG